MLVKNSHSSCYIFSGGIIMGLKQTFHYDLKKKAFFKYINSLPSIKILLINRQFHERLI